MEAREDTTLAMQRGELVSYQKDRQTQNGGRRGFRMRPKMFVFFDKATNMKRFEIKASADGSLPSEQAVTLLALQCVARGKSPSDFSVMISVGENLMEGLMSRTRKLIRHCMATLPVHVSQRQQQVLRGILQNRSNKEIAGTLSLSVFTVKFHVAALLQKFDVQDRVGLMQKTSDMFSGEKVSNLDGSASMVGIVPQEANSDSSNLSPKLIRLANSERRVMAR
jgi:DNA-binding CsgD family transcriptional regulator